MAHDIIMPMLGMAQDTGTIVAWRKKLGDPVKAGDILMEVETDKSTVEVEAGHDGFLAAVMAETGVPIPVGEVVAVISGDPGDVKAAAVTEPTAAKSAVEAPAPQEQAAPAAPPAREAPATAPAPPPRTAPLPAQPSAGRVLASPKARREAEARGVDLGRLVRLGVPEPIHVADLDKAGAAAAARAFGTSLMRVRVDRAPFEAFVKWIDEEAGVEVSGLNVWAAFAVGSLRKATRQNSDDEIVVNASRFPQGDAVTLRNPDQAGLARLMIEGDGSPSLTLLDLTETPLTEYRPAGERPLPHLTIANGQDAANFDLYLEFDPALLPDAAAFEFLKDLADRAHVPLRHLL